MIRLALVVVVALSLPALAGAAPPAPHHDGLLEDPFGGPSAHDAKPGSKTAAQAPDDDADDAADTVDAKGLRPEDAADAKGTAPSAEDVADAKAGAAVGRYLANGGLDDVAAARPAVAAPPPPPVDLPAPSMGTGELLGQLLKMVLMLGVVVALAYLTLSKGLGKLVERQNLGKRVKVVERVALDTKRSLFLVEVDGKQMLLGAGEGGVIFIRDVDAKAAPAQPTVGFADALKRSFKFGGEPPVTTPLAKTGDDPKAPA